MQAATCNRDLELSNLQRRISTTRDELNDALINLGRYMNALAKNDLKTLAMLNHVQKFNEHDSAFSNIHRNSH